MLTPYHVRLAISQYGDQLRAELFTEDLGDTNGDLLPTKWERLNDDFKSYLSMGAAGLPSDTARRAGQELFDYMLGSGENGKKWIEILHQAKRQNRPIRLLIDATTDLVRDLPYGLLCDSADDYYLLRPGTDRPAIRFARILRRCTPRVLDLSKPRQKLLVVAAEPLKLPTFECAARLCELAKGLSASYDVSLCLSDRAQSIGELITVSVDQWEPKHFEPLCRAGRDALRHTLRSGEYDILHVLAHGIGTGIVLCDEQGARAEVTSTELGEWCGASKLQMAFLQVCKASLTDGRGGFGGVAQQLLNPKYGNLAAVVASPYPVDAERSLPAALAFYASLAAGQSLDAAIDRGLDETNWAWAFLELWVRPSALKDTGNRGAFQFASPYRGLSRFEERDAEIFFGRESETAELLTILSDEPVVAVVGDSGSGKSSLLQAGLTPHIRQHGIAETPGWQIVSLSPGDRPWHRLLSRLKHRQMGDTVNVPLTADWQSDLHEALISACSDDRRLLILFDQFEEIFTLCQDETESRELAEALADIAQRRPDSFRLILGMRSEYLGQAAALPGLIGLIKRPWVLKPPAGDQVRAIVFEPADHHGYAFEGSRDDGDSRHALSLLERILQDPLLTSAPPADRNASDGNAREDCTRPSAPLPLLEFALERLWLKAVQRGSREFLHSDYDAMGGLAGAIAQRAEEVYVSLSSRPDFVLQDKADAAKKGHAAPADILLIAERIWTGLISSRGTRRPRNRGDLETETGNPEVGRKVIDFLVGERLLTIRSDAEDLANVNVDISHEVLIQRWDRLREWLETGAEGRALKEEFQKDAERWHEGMPGTSARSRKNLPSSQAINLYLTWIDRIKPPLTDAQQVFSLAMRKSVRQKKWLLRFVVVASVLVAMAMTMLAVWAWREQIDSERSLALSEIQRGVADCEAGKPAAGMSWLLRAYKTVHPNDTLRLAVRNLMAGWDDSLGTCLLDERPMIGIAFSHDGKNIITVCQNGWIRLWDVAEPGIRRDLFDHGSELVATAFSGDAKYILTSGEDKIVRIWDLTDPSNPPKAMELPHKDKGVVMSLAFSDDGSKVVTGWTTDEGFGQAQIWERKTGDPVSKLSQKGELLALAMSPDAKWICTSAGDGTVCLWESDGKNSALSPVDLMRGQQHVIVVAFSPDGKSVFAGSENGQSWLWKMDDPQKKPVELHDNVGVKAHMDRVSSVAFSPKSDKLITGSMDNTARLWDVESGKPLGRVMSHGGPIVVAQFSRDGTKVLTGAGDGRTQFWNAETGTRLTAPLYHDHQIRVAALSPDASMLATGTWGHVARLWNVAESQRFEQIIDSDAAVTALACNPDTNDGLLLAVGNEDGKIQIWDVDNKKPIEQQPPPHRKRVTAIAFSPDGKSLATASWDTTATLWNLLRSDRDPLVLPHNDKVTSLAFSADGTKILTGCLDHSVHIWNAENGERVGNLRQLDSAILAVAFSPDGETFVTGHVDNKAHIWNSTTFTRIGEPLQHNADVVAVAFSPDGKMVLTGSWDGTAILWDAATGRALGQPLRHAGPKVVTVAFSPDSKTVLTGSWEGTASLWEVVTGMARGAAMWHEPRVHAVAFSPNSDSVFTGSNDGTVRMWPFPRAVRDDPLTPNHVQLWVETRTGRYWDENNFRRLLSYREWLDRYKFLNRDGATIGPGPASEKDLAISPSPNP